MKLPLNIDKSQLIDALRLALQSSVSALITFTVMSSYNIPEIFLGLLSAVLIVEPSIGNTFNQAKGRILATLVGSAIGFLCVSVSPWGFATAISIFIVMFIMNGISSYRPDWRYGVVAALAIALGSENDALSTSLDRVIAILIGVVIGIVVSLIVWPDRASNRSRRYLNKALLAASDRFDKAVINTRQTENEGSESIELNYHKNIDAAERSAEAIRFGDKEKIQKEINITKKLYNSIIIIHRVAVHSDSHVSDGEAGIENDSENAKNLACKITKAFANNTEVKTSEIEELSDMVDNIKSNIQSSDDDKRINTLRYAFIFGLYEIKDSLKALYDAEQNKDN